MREEGWKWVEALLSVDSMALRQFVPCPYVTREPTAAEQEQLNALAERSADLDRQVQALDDASELSLDEAERIDLEEQDIAARPKAVRDALKAWVPEVKAHAGVIVMLGREGHVEVLRGLVRDQDRKAVAATTGALSRLNDVDGDVNDGEGADDGDRASRPSSASSERRAPGLSEALLGGWRRIGRWRCRACWRRAQRSRWHRWCMSSFCAPSVPTTPAKRPRCR